MFTYLYSRIFIQEHLPSAHVGATYTYDVNLEPRVCASRGPEHLGASGPGVAAPRVCDLRVVAVRPSRIFSSGRPHVRIRANIGCQHGYGVVWGRAVHSRCRRNGHGGEEGGRQGLSRAGAEVGCFCFLILG
eukprot:5709347-Prymnesium_polylepis.2